MDGVRQANGKDGGIDRTGNDSFVGVGRIIGITCGTIAMLIFVIVASVVLARGRKREREDDAEEVPIAAIAFENRGDEESGNISGVRPPSRHHSVSPLRSSFRYILGERSLSPFYSRSRSKSKERRVAMPPPSPSRTYSQMVEDRRPNRTADALVPTQPPIDNDNDSSPVDATTPAVAPVTTAAADTTADKAARLERELNSLYVMIRTFPEDSHERKMLSFNCEIVKAELLLLEQEEVVSTSTDADGMNETDDEDDSASSSSTSRSTDTSASFSGSVSTSTSISTNSISPRLNSSHDSSREMGDSSYISSSSTPSSQDTLPFAEQNSNLKSLVKDVLDNDNPDDDDQGVANPNNPNEADMQQIRDLEAELQALSLSVQLYRRDDEKWRQLKTYMERAQRELDVVRLRSGIRLRRSSSSSGRIISSSSSNLDVNRIRRQPRSYSASELGRRVSFASDTPSSGNEESSSGNPTRSFAAWHG